MATHSPGAASGRRGDKYVLIPAELAGRVVAVLCTGRVILEARARKDGYGPNAYADLDPIEIQLLQAASSIPAEEAERRVRATAYPTMNPRLPVTSWLLASEAADVMGVSAAYVRRLAGAGRIRAERRGRDWQIERQAAEDYGRARRDRERSERRRR
ncbi:MAG TPA: excisionase family DNA-binding protein [Streptosporangiaceae bacterium]|jgi:excisionase family DNA binding protein